MAHATGIMERSDDSTAQYDAGTKLVREIWAVTAISMVAVILRVVAKLRIRQFKWDDIVMIAAQCLGITGSAVITVAVQHGFGRHVWDIPKAGVSKVIFFDYLSQAFGNSASCLGRVSFIIYIVNLLGSERKHKVILWCLVFLQVATNVVTILIMFLQCPGHGSAIWDQPGESKCWGVTVQAYYGYFQGSFNSATDLYLAVFPTYIFWNLNLKLRAKAGLMALLGLGIFAMAASIVKTVQIRVLARQDDDPTAATVVMDRWLFIETYLVITTASIPCIRSLIITHRRNRSNHLNSHELSSGYGKGTVPSFAGKQTATTVSWKYMKHDNGDTGSEDNILPSGPSNEAHTPDSGIVKRVDITVSVGDSGPSSGQSTPPHAR